MGESYDVEWDIMLQLHKLGVLVPAVPQSWVGGRGVQGGD